MVYSSILCQSNPLELLMGLQEGEMRGFPLQVPPVSRYLCFLVVKVTSRELIPAPPAPPPQLHYSFPLQCLGSQVPCFRFEWTGMQHSPRGGNIHRGLGMGTGQCPRTAYMCHLSGPFMLFLYIQFPHCNKVGPLFPFKSENTVTLFRKGLHSIVCQFLS